MYIVKFASVDEGKLLLGVTTTGHSQDVECEVRFIDHDRFVVRGYLGKACFSPTVISEDFIIFQINLQELIANYEFDSNNQRLEFMMKKDQHYYPLMTRKEINNMLGQVVSIEDKVSLKYIKREKGIFDLRVVTEPSQIEIVEVKIEDGILYLSTNKMEDFDIYVKRRTFKNITKYSAERKLAYRDGRFSINLKELFPLVSHYQTNFDFAIRNNSTKSKVDYLIKMNSDLPKQKLTIDHYVGELYTTTTNSVALSMKRAYGQVEAEIEVDNDVLHVQLRDQQINKLIFFRKLPLQESTTDMNEFCAVHSDTNNGSYRINLQELFKKNTSNMDQEYVVLGSKNGEYYHLVNGESKTVKGDFINVQINSKQTKIKNPLESKAIRLAILGSCYSRAAFNSTNDFFNRDYKTYYTVNYSYFWFSALSSMSKPIPYKEEFLSNESEKIKENDAQIRREFEKTLFQELREKQVDYVILDFFVDAVHGVRDFGEGRYLARNVDLNSTNFFKNQVLLETKHFSYKDEDYFDKWCESMDRFIKEIQHEIPLNKIILNSGGLTNDFLNDNNEIRSFSRERNFEEKMIKNHNVMWQKMNNYFLTKNPEASFIDLSRYDFYASGNYPNAASGPHHYEPNYYKAYLGELSKAILKNTY